jgi:hypothetical protein
VVEFSAINDEVRISCWEPRLDSSGSRLSIKKAGVFVFQLRSGAAPLEVMASAQEKATSGVLRNAAALLDEMQLMGETQGEYHLLIQNSAFLCRVLA